MTNTTFSASNAAMDFMWLMLAELKCNEQHPDWFLIGNTTFLLTLPFGRNECLTFSHSGSYRTDNNLRMVGKKKRMVVNKDCYSLDPWMILWRKVIIFPVLPIWRLISMMEINYINYINHSYVGLHLYMQLSLFPN